MLFYSCHKYVGIIGSEGARHCSALNLLIKFTNKGEMVIFKYEDHHLFDVTCMQWGGGGGGAPIMLPDGNEACLDTRVFWDVGL